MNRERIVEDLFHAVKTGSLEDTKKLLNSYGLSDFPALSEGYHLLLKTLENGYTEIAELLLSNNCRVNHEDPQRKETTPLHVAVEAREIKIVQMLLDRQAEINARDHKIRTPLMIAISDDISEPKQKSLSVECQLSTKISKTEARKRLDIIELLVKSGADVSAAASGLATSLHVAVAHGDVDVMEILLNNNSDPNAKDANGESLLHYAVRRKFDDPKTAIAIVESLLNHGADLNLLDFYGETPLHKTIACENLEMMEILVDKHADVNAIDNNGSTPLHHATAKMAWTEDFEVAKAMIKLLLEHGADPNVYDRNGRTPLSTVCEGLPEFEDIEPRQYFDENCRIVDIFLSHGADLNGSIVINGFRSYTPLKSAADSGCDSEFIEYLISKGAQVNPENDDKFTSLYHAAKNGDEAIVKVLLDHGATTDPEGSNGKSILQIAVDSGCPRVVEQIFQSFYANNKSLTRSVKMTLSNLPGKRFFQTLRTWLKDRAGKNTGITDDQYRKFVRNFLQDACDVAKYCDGVESTTEDDWKEARIAMLLQSNGIDIDFRDDHKKGILCFAIKYGDVEMTRLCLTGQTKVETDALNVAVVMGRREMVDILLEADPSMDLNARVDGVTPLVCTAMDKKDFPFIDESDLIVNDDAKDDIARLLVAKGADVNTRWDNVQVSESLLTIAARNNRVKLVEFFMECNSEHYRHRFSHDQAIHAAARYNRLDVVKVLLRRGVDIDIPNSYGKTALDIACSEGHAEMVKFLLDQGASMGASFKDFFLNSSKCSSEVYEVIQRHVLQMNV